MTDSQFTAKLNYIRELIDSQINGQRVVPKGYLEAAVREHGSIFNFSQIEVERFTRHLETIYGTSQDTGHILKKNFTEWYAQEKKNIDPHYWEKQYFLRQLFHQLMKSLMK